MESESNDKNARSSQASLMMFGGLLSVPSKYEIHVKVSAAVAVAVVSAAPWRVLRALWSLVWTSVGVALGVGFGLGLAMHVYEQLQRWHRQEAHDKIKHDSVSSTVMLLDGSRPKSHHVLSKAQSNVLEDSSSYFAMMALAGYTVPDRVLRGQVLKTDSSFFQVKYPFTDVRISEQMGPCLLKDDWPRLPEPVTRELGRFVEHVMRDYIAGWYCKLDHGCVYTDERSKRAAGVQRDGTRADNNHDDNTVSNTAAATASRRMVTSTLTHRTIPFLDQTYRVLSAAFGSLATRAEHVNIFSLALLKWTHVLAQTFKQYRQLRKVAQEKNETEHPREIEIIREFLLAGKLHKAVTFGLDVPSLLFADAHGVECGTSSVPKGDGHIGPRDATQVLEERLFGSPDLLKECQLDYNRCLAFRLVRALLPKHESNSQVVMALVTEIFGACVLQPLMNLWIPSFLNEIIVNATASTDEEKEKAATSYQKEAQTREARASGASPSTKSGTATEASQKRNRKTVPITSPPRASSIGSPARSDSESNVSAGNSSVLVMSHGRSRMNSSDTIFDEGKTMGEMLLKVSATTIAKVESLIPLEERRMARLNGQPAIENTTVDYDDPDCQHAVIRLVLVLEAALLHGRCAVRGRKRPSGESEDDDDEPEANFLQVLMELTSDMDAFERRIRSLSQSSSKRELEADSGIHCSPDPNELSTIRTLVSTWFHTGCKSCFMMLRTPHVERSSFYALSNFFSASAGHESSYPGNEQYATSVLSGRRVSSRFQAGARLSKSNWSL